jgi:hypothetical protein
VQKYIFRAVFFIIAGAILCPHALTTKAHGLAESTGPNGSNAQAVHALGEISEGINVGLISAENTRTTHEAFEDSNGVVHAFHYDFTDDGNLYEPSSHDTWVAGIVASRGGVSHPNDIGVAPGVDIHSAKVTRGATGPSDPNRVISFAWLENALDSLINDHNCRVIVNRHCTRFHPQRPKPIDTALRLLCLYAQRSLCQRRGQQRLTNMGIRRCL